MFEIIICWILNIYRSGSKYLQGKLQAFCVLFLIVKLNNMVANKVKQITYESLLQLFIKGKGN
jgi:hypothetical protein